MESLYPTFISLVFLSSALPVIFFLGSTYFRRIDLGFSIGRFLFFFFFLFFSFCLDDNHDNLFDDVVNRNMLKSPFGNI